MRRSLLLAVAVLLVLATPRAALAWGDKGHEIVAWIAYQGLTPSARQQVDALLQHLTWSDLHRREQEELSSTRDEFKDQGPAIMQLMVAAILPDKIRVSDPNDPRRGWHFVDWPIEAGHSGPPPSNNNAFNALSQVLLPEIARPATDAATRAIDLAFVIHLVGDLHQPLHCATRYTAEGPDIRPRRDEDPYGDKGGNYFKIARVHVPSRSSPVRELHAYWDDLPDLGTDGMTVAQAAQAITAAQPRTEFTAELRQPDPKAWSLEGRDLASRAVYTPEMLQQHDVSVYGTAAWELAQQRLALTGYRLADLLNGVLGQ
jgi:S1/P1 nuclease